MAFAIIFQALAFLAIAFDFFASFARFRKLNRFDQSLVLLSYFSILTTHAGAIFRAHLTNFKAIAIFFQAMRPLTFASFAIFKWGCHFLHSVFNLIEIFRSSLIGCFLRAHPRIILLWSHLRGL